FACLDEMPTPANGDASPLTGLGERYRSYWGIDVQHLRIFARMADRFGADVVVVTGLEVLPLLGAIRGACRVWYAADEWCWHHLSQVRLADPASWTNVRDAAIKGLYERAFRRHLDRVWVVSTRDAMAMRWIAGVPGVDVVPNGVDS